MKLIFTPPAQPAIPVEDSALAFPVRRIWCVGRNYADHAREMGGDPRREPPFFFAKPADALAAGGGVLPFPLATGDLHHEVELAVALDSGGVDLSPQEALACVYGYAVALDMTRRDLQAQAKRDSRPWDMAKGFDQSCPISPLRPARGRGASGGLTLKVNGEVRQTGQLSDMIWSVADCIAALSQLVQLAPGDILLTGTPAGVGPVLVGDVLEASCDATPSLRVTYLARPAASEPKACL